MTRDPSRVVPTSKVPHVIHQRRPDGTATAHDCPNARMALGLVASWLHYNAKVARNVAARWPNTLTTYGVWFEHDSGYAYMIEKG